MFKKRALYAPPHHSLTVVTLPRRGWYLSSLTLLLLLMPLFSSPMYQILCSAVFIQQWPFWREWLPSCNSLLWLSLDLYSWVLNTVYIHWPCRGGIKLTFDGTNLNAVQHPFLVVNDRDYLDDINVGHWWIQSKVIPVYALLCFTRDTMLLPHCIQYLYNLSDWHERMHQYTFPSLFVRHAVFNQW